jgi:hypothetical protein
MTKNLTITVTKIEGNSVSYDGVPWASGCHIDNFPHHPKVGENFVLEYDDEDFMVVVRINTVSLRSEER